MIDHLYLLADAAELFGKPFWEQPDRLASPGMIAIGVFAYSLWKVWKGTASVFAKLTETLAILQQHLPAIIAALQAGKAIAPTVPSVPSPVPPPVIQPHVAPPTPPAGP